MKNGISKVGKFLLGWFMVTMVIALAFGFTWAALDIIMSVLEWRASGEPMPTVYKYILRTITISFLLSVVLYHFGAFNEEGQ